MNKDQFPFIKKAFEKKKYVLWDMPVTITKITRLGILGVPMYHIKAHNKKEGYIRKTFYEGVFIQCLKEKQKTYFNSNTLTVKVSFQYPQNLLK